MDCKVSHYNISISIDGSLHFGTYATTACVNYEAYVRAIEADKPPLQRFSATI